MIYTHFFQSALSISIIKKKYWFTFIAELDFFLQSVDFMLHLTHLKKSNCLFFFSRCVDTMNTFSFLLKMKLETFMRGFVPGEFCIHGYNQQCWRVRWCKECFAHNVTTSSITETRYGRCCPYFVFTFLI